jgi:Stress responsive A/B Barrel Domain
MRFGILILAICGSLGMAMTLTRTTKATVDEKPAKTLRHIVLYKFKNDLKPRQVQEVIDAFAALPKKIDTVIGFEHGVNISAEGKSEGLTHCFVVTFRDEKGRDAYLVHPAHLEYVKLAKDRREKVVVFDYWTK